MLFVFYVYCSCTGVTAKGKRIHFKDLSYLTCKCFLKKDWRGNLSHCDWFPFVDVIPAFGCTFDCSLCFVSVCLKVRTFNSVHHFSLAQFIINVFVLYLIKSSSCDLLDDCTLCRKMILKPTLVVVHLRKKNSKTM